MPNKIEACSLAGPKRIHYFDGRFLSAEDLRTEQDYLIGKHRQLARAALGVGILEGLVVSGGTGGLTVSPGLALDGLGRLIELPGACSCALPGRTGAWDVSIGLVEEPCDPVPKVPPGPNDEDGFQPSMIQDIVKVWIEEAEASSGRPGTDGAVWLGRLRVTKRSVRVDGAPRRRPRLRAGVG